MFHVLPPNRFVSALFAALITCSCFAGSVRTVDGRVFDGELRFDQDKLQVTPRRGQPVKLDVADLLFVSFRAPDQPRPQPAQPPRPPAGGGELSGNWKPQDIGVVGTPGDVRFYNGVYAVKGAGTNIFEKSDSFYFVPQELPGDCSITARIVEMQRGDGFAKVGVMIRSSLDPSAKHLFIYVTPRDGLGCFWRTEQGKHTERMVNSREMAPLWVRITRRQNTFTSFKSSDGLNWIQVEQHEIAMDPRAFVGLAVCSHDRAGSLAATFDNVNAQPGTPRDDDPTRRTSGPAVAPLSRAIIFRRGTILANVQVQSANAESLRVQRPDGKQMTIPSAEVARVILAPIPPQTLAKIPDRGTGVLLARGDFMEGDLQGYADGRVRLSSVLFGLSNFAAGIEAAVLVFNEPQPSRSNFVVRTTDGSIYYASSLKIDRDQLLIDDDSAGPVKVSMGNLVEIKAGEARFDPLAELKPAKLEAGEADPAKAYTVGAASPGGPSLTDTVATTLVSTRAGTSVSYELNGKYKVFLARAGVPEGILPTIAVRYSILVDGVEAYHSSPRTSLDEPAVVSVNLAGAKSITLRVDPAPAGLPATVLWADPALMK